MDCLTCAPGGPIKADCQVGTNCETGAIIRVKEHELLLEVATFLTDPAPENVTRWPLNVIQTVVPNLCNFRRF